MPELKTFEEIIKPEAKLGSFEDIINSEVEDFDEKPKEIESTGFEDIVEWATEMQVPFSS